MPHDKTLKWTEESYPLQSGFHIVSSDQWGVTVKGVCPRCDGASPWTFPIVPPGVGASIEAEDVKTAGDRLDPDPVTIVCACGAEHARAEGNDEDGCGAYWTIDLKSLMEGRT